MEWVHDYYDERYYLNSPKDNPNGPKIGKNRVLRGGSWRSGKNKLRVFGRSLGESSQGKSNIGFRCAK
jgi:iron(II)-dependent oxidoreductase